MKTENNPVIKIKQSLTLVPDPAEKYPAVLLLETGSFSQGFWPQAGRLYSYRIDILH